jgi:hypothetical protein
MTEHMEHEHLEDLPPIHVRMSERVTARHESAEFGSYMTFTLTGTEQAQRILPRDPRRARAVILVRSTSGTVWIGTQAQTQAKTPLGGNLGNGQSIEIRNQQDVWLIGDGTNTATVTVLVEQWER